MKMHMAENFMRSAKAPAISPGVMIANVIWNIMNTVSGMVVAVSLPSTPLAMVKGLSHPSPMPLRRSRDRSPM